MKTFILVPMLALVVAASSGCANRSTTPTPYVAPPDRILLLHRQGLSDEQLIGQIEAQRLCGIAIPDDLDRLRKAGVSDGVVRYLQGCSAARLGRQAYPYAYPYRPAYSYYYYPPVYYYPSVYWTGGAHHFGGYHHGGVGGYGHGRHH